MPPQRARRLLLPRPQLLPLLREEEAAPLGGVAARGAPRTRPSPPRGFSAHVGEPIGPEDKQRLEDTGATLVRNPLSLRKLVYLDGQQAVLYRSRMNPSLGATSRPSTPSSGWPA